MTDMRANLGANAMALLCTSFSGFSHQLVGPGSRFFDVPLGLYAAVLVDGDAVRYRYFLDSARTQPAGSFMLAANDGAQSQSGTFFITAGRFAGLSGTYFDAVQTGGVEGSITFSFPNGTTQVSQFVEETSGGTDSGTATIGLAETSGYTQTQRVSYNEGGTISVTSRDSSGYQSTFSFASDLSGTGTVSGSDPGLPAAITWNSQGTGTVKFADGSVHALTAWTLGS
jgi:hypothetical protein